MRFFRRSAGRLLLACGVLFPITLAAQSREPSSPAKAPALNDQQKSGEALFLQNCPLCHIASEQKKRLGIPTPSLAGRFRGEKPLSEDVVRQFILRGVPGKMPSFQYDLEPKQIDDIMAYLKTL